MGIRKAKAPKVEKQLKGHNNDKDKIQDHDVRDGEMVDFQKISALLPLFKLPLYLPAFLLS